MAIPNLNDLKFWVGTLFNKDDWDRVIIKTKEYNNLKYKHVLYKRK